MGGRVRPSRARPKQQMEVQDRELSAPPCSTARFELRRCVRDQSRKEPIIVSCGPLDSQKPSSTWSSRPGSHPSYAESPDRSRMERPQRTVGRATAIAATSRSSTTVGLPRTTGNAAGPYVKTRQKARTGPRIVQKARAHNGVSRSRKPAWDRQPHAPE